MFNKDIITTAKMCGATLHSKIDSLSIRGVTINSRETLGGQLYVPIIGKRFDGHDFLEEAKRKGAVAALWQKGRKLPEIDIPLLIVEDTLQALQELARNYRQQLQCKVVAITGSNGKTSTKDIVYQLLSRKYRTYKTQGNKNNEIGLPLTILEADADIEYLVLEMGMSAREEISFLSRLAQPDLAIITGIGKAHLEDLGCLEAIIEAKLEILDGLSPTGTLYVFGDNEELRQRLNAHNPQQKIVYYGEDIRNDYHISDIQQHTTKTSFKIAELSSSSFQCSLLGYHQAYNATAAILLAQTEKVSEQEIRAGLLEVAPIGNRLEVIPLKNSIILNDSYKSNPESLEAALKTLDNMPSEYHKIAVLADMKDLGGEAISSHIRISEMLQPETIEYLYTIGDMADLFNSQGKYDQEHYHHYQETEALYQLLKKSVLGKNIILIKGANVFGLSQLVERLQEEMK